MDTLGVALQLLSSDEAAVQNLAYVLSTVVTPTSSALASPSPSRKLWIARVNSLQERPKHPGARWAGLCLAQRTAQLSRDLLLTSADNWISYALPVLSRDEPLPTINAAIHLLSTVYTSILDMPEFHRRVVIPTAQKFSIALLGLTEKPETPVKLKALCMHTLTLLVHHHPTLHIAIQARLQNLTLVHLSGSYPSTSDDTLVHSAADLHAVLHLTGGKVRGAAAWRRSVDGTVSSILSALSELTSILGSSHGAYQSVAGFDLPPVPIHMPQMAVLVIIDRLRSLVALLVSLLRCSTSRPVTFPVGALANLTQRLIGVDSNALATQEQTNGVFVDPAKRVMEAAVVPALWQMGCTLLMTLSASVTHHLTPYAATFGSTIAHQLDQPIPSEQRLHFLRALTALLSSSHAYPISNTFLSTRLLKSLLPCLTSFLAEGLPPAAVNGTGDEHTSAKAKKKAKLYEGDEVFKTSRDVLLRNAAEGEEVLATLHVLPLLISSPHTNPATSSVASRLLLSLLLHLPQMPATLVSADPSMHSRILDKVIWACDVTILHDAGNPWLKRGLGLVAGIVGQKQATNDDLSAIRSLSLLIHPHLPPNARAITSSIENIPLYRSEGKEEREAREAMRLVSLEDVPEFTQQQPPNVSAIGQHQPASAGGDVQMDSSDEVPTTARFAPDVAPPPPVTTQRAASSFNSPWTTSQNQNQSQLAPSHSTPTPTPAVSSSASSTSGIAPAPAFTRAEQAPAPIHDFIPLASTSSGKDEDFEDQEEYDDEDEDDEPIPEIHMGSDSDDE